MKNFDFRIANKRIINKIKFKPFDYSKAGVYGTDEWIQKAKFDAARAEAFDQMVAEHEKE